MHCGVWSIKVKCEPKWVVCGDDDDTVVSFETTKWENEQKTPKNIMLQYPKKWKDDEKEKEEEVKSINIENGKDTALMQEESWSE